MKDKCLRVRLKGRTMCVANHVGLMESTTLLLAGAESTSHQSVLEDFTRLQMTDAFVCSTDSRVIIDDLMLGG